MSVQKMDCPICGYRFDVSNAGACGSCPLASGCNLVCCPNCGHTTVDLERSGLVRLATRIGAIFRGEKSVPLDEKPVEEFILLERPAVPVPENGAPGREPEGSGVPRRLSEIPLGERVRVVSLGAGLTPPRCARLQAYGVVPGYWVKVIQHDPVTVIEVDHLELAMEGEVAEGIWVAIPSPPKTSAPNRAANTP